MLFLIALLIILIVAGAGFALHVLWWIAIALFVLWLIGFAFGAAESGSRRRWYGRW